MYRFASAAGAILSPSRYPKIGTFTATPLAASATYTGAAKDLQECHLSFFNVMAFADQAGTMYIEQSHDNSNWDYSTDVALAAGATEALKQAIFARYVRPKYVNGGTDQTSFRFGGRYAIA